MQHETRWAAVLAGDATGEKGFIGWPVGSGPGDMSRSGTA